MIGIEADIFEIVVFAAGANALLGIGRASGFGGNGAGPFIDIRRALAEEDRDELVHACVREQQVGGVRHQARRGHDGVRLRFEEIQVGLANLGARHWV